MLPFPTPGNLSYPGIKAVSFSFPALAGRFFTDCAAREAPSIDTKKHFFLCRVNLVLLLRHGRCGNSYLIPCRLQGPSSQADGNVNYF